jgi:hypothetical protein
MTNETPLPNENKRLRMGLEMLDVAELSDAVTALITACLEVFWTHAFCYNSPVRLTGKLKPSITPIDANLCRRS